MKNRNLLILVVAGAVLAALAWMTSREKPAVGTNRIGNKLMPDLAINAVDEVIISTATQTARVTKVDNSWVLPDRYDYPANFENIRRLILKLADLEIGQAFKASDNQREQMELTPDDATAITLKADGNPIAELHLGVNRESANASSLPYGMGGMTDGRYLTIKDDPMVYLVGDSLHDAEADPKHWMDTSLLDVSADTVTAISITNPEDGTFALITDEEGNLGFKNPEQGKPFDDTKNYSLKGALSYLKLQDIADPAADDETLGFTSPRRFSVDTEDGTTYSLRVSDPIDESGDRYVRIAVGFEAPPLTPTDTPPEAKTEDAASTNVVAAAAAANRKTEADAQALHARLSPWTFRIASYKASTLTSAREALVKAPEAAATDDQTDPSDQTDQSAAPDKQPDKTNQPESKETSDE